MKLLRIGEPGHEKPAILDGDGKARDLSSIVADIADGVLRPDSLADLAKLELDALPEIAGGRIGPCAGGGIARCCYSCRRSRCNGGRR